jgi:cell division protein FtsL
MRILNVAAVFLALASAFLLYGLNYDTRMIEARLHAREREAERARADIAVLRAERAHLARPERIEPLARGLGLEPLAARHLLPGPIAPDLTTSSTDR